MNFLTFNDPRLGELQINFRHIFDKPQTRTYLKNGSIIVGDVAKTQFSHPKDNYHTVDFGNTGRFFSFTPEEVTKVDTVIPGNHRKIGKTICHIYSPKLDQWWQGEAICGREDKFSRRTGRALSFFRALIELTEFSGMTFSQSFAEQITQAFTARNYGLYLKEAFGGADYIESVYPEFKYVTKAIKEKLEDIYGAFQMEKEYARAQADQLNKLLFGV